MVYVPAGLEIEICAVSPFRATGFPKFVPSITNCTKPSGGPRSDETVAVRVADWPTGIEEFAGVTVVEVAALPTSSVAPVIALARVAAKMELPRYCAVMT